jgi:hypothetical protein
MFMARKISNLFVEDEELEETAEESEVQIFQDPAGGNGRRIIK